MILSVYTLNKKRINLEGKELRFDFEIPNIFPEDFLYLLWWEHEGRCVFYTASAENPLEQVEHILEPTEENYTKYAKPFVELWEAEYERVCQVRIQKQLTDAIQRVLDNKAQELNYDNCLSVCSYIDTGVPKFDAEGKAFRSWRSQVWARGYEILAQVQRGERAIPTEEELIAELPELIIVYEEDETPKSSLDYLNSLGQ